MNLRQITIFIDLAETLSTTKTAKNLYLAQPAVSLAIKELEGEYNIKLFNNIKQRLSLTDAGVELLAYAKNIINSVELFDEKANNLLLRPRLRLASSLSVGENYLPDIVKKIGNQEIDLAINIMISSKIIEGVISGEFDLGIIESPCNDQMLTKIKLKNDKLIAVANPFFYSKKSIQINDLIKYPLLLRDEQSGTRAFLDSALASLDLKLKPFLSSSSNQGLISFALKSLGIAILAKSSVNDFINNGLVEIKIEGIELNREINLIYLKTKKLNDKELELVDFLKKSL